MNQLEAVFANLDRWRHLPNYQLERRADIFFSVCLRGLVEEETGVALDETIIPELPIKRDLIWADLATDKSVKVDYVLFAKDRSRVFFVELKTDAGSRRDAQDHYLEIAKQLGFRKIVEGLCSIMRKTTSHQKYHHLAAMLAALGYLKMPGDIRDFLYPAPRLGLGERLREIAPTGTDSAVEVLYVQPLVSEGARCIDFERFAVFVEKHDDPLSRVRIVLVRSLGSSGRESSGWSQCQGSATSMVAPPYPRRASSLNFGSPKSQSARFWSGPHLLGQQPVGTTR